MFSEDEISRTRSTGRSPDEIVDVKGFDVLMFSITVSSSDLKLQSYGRLMMCQLTKRDNEILFYVVCKISNVKS